MFSQSDRELRKAVNRQSRFILIYTLLFVLGTVIGMFALNWDAIWSSAWNNATDEAINALFNRQSGALCLISLAVGMLFVLLKRRGRLVREDLRARPAAERRPMNAKVFLSCVVLLFSAQLLYMLADVSVRAVARQLGYTMVSAMDSLGAAELTGAMILYVGFLGPLVEEILFRGTILRGLESCGKLFAIGTSAVLFGLFHGDFVQGVFAAACGLLFGYVALEYSFRWALVLHIFNNFLLSTVLDGLLGLLPGALQGPVQTALTVGIGAVGGLYLLVRHRKALAAYWRATHLPFRTYAVGWTAVWFLLLWAVQVATACMGFSKIS